MAERLMIYPFSIETAPIIRFSFLVDYEICAAVSPQSWGYTGKDLCFCDGGPETGIIVSENFADALHKSDVVFMDFVSDKICKEVYVKNIHMCLAQGKKTIITHRLAEYMGNTLPSSRFISIIGDNRANETDATSLVPIKTPTIIIVGVGECCDKFSVQLAVREYFSGKCNSVLQFGTKGYSELFGILPLPDYLYKPGDISKKIISLNRHIHQAVKKARPELLIIGIPGGFSYMTMETPRNFGELAFCISSAVVPDACILCVYNDKYEQDYLQAIAAKAAGKLSCEIDAIHISNRKLLLDPDALDQKVGFLTVGSTHLSLPNGTFNVFDKAQTNTALSHIYHMLVNTENIV